MYKDVKYTINFTDDCIVIVLIKPPYDGNMYSTRGQKA